MAAADRESGGIATDAAFHTACMRMARNAGDYRAMRVMWRGAFVAAEAPLTPDGSALQVVLYGVAGAIRRAKAAGELRGENGVSGWVAFAEEAWHTVPKQARGFRVFTRLMEVYGEAGDVPRAERLLPHAPRVRSLGGKMCPYFTEHLENAYRNAGLTAADAEARIARVLGVGRRTGKHLVSEASAGKVFRVGGI
eukprot:TRINITY_DN3763_c0_g2_i4.p2 TRINITY_DN3763_c0_g2~~TRINITY_DN3763_c0_g2_i4.p2  ORF type:complete len:195 (+),score=56.95 TRINITY_DN3763_c0_g2_i4:208-792(+)